MWTKLTPISLSLQCPLPRRPSKLCRMGLYCAHDRCTGWILNEDDDDNSDYYTAFYGGTPDYDGVPDYGGVIASPNITESSASNNTLEDCSFTQVDLGIHYSQSQQCAAACQNCEYWCHSNGF